MTDAKRKENMDRMNPKFILRNYLMEEAIKKAEGGDFTRVEELMKMAEEPFSDEKVSDEATKPAPKWAYKLCVSCSS